MDWGRILKELRLGLAELSGIKAAAFWFIAAVFVLLLAGRGLWLASWFLLSLR